MRTPALLAAAVLALALPAAAGLYPAGSTNAVLSVVVDGYAEVTRWWPGKPVRVLIIRRSRP